MARVSLTTDDRNSLLDYHRSDPDPQVRLRARILLLLTQGYPWATVAAGLFTSPDTIARWSRRFAHEGGPRRCSGGGGAASRRRRLKAVCGPGDDGKPVFTVMVPAED
jgi:hypothetical protein